jgi:hypothetical protein
MCRKSEIGKMKRTYYIAVLTFVLGAIAYSCAGSSARAIRAQSTAVDDLCAAEGNFAQVVATQRDKGQSLSDSVAVIDHSPEIMNAMSPEFRAGVKEHLQTIYAHPEISPTQERQDAVNACYSIHGSPSEPKANLF